MTAEGRPGRDGADEVCRRRSGCDGPPIGKPAMTSRLVVIAVALLVVLYAAALRLDALTMRFGPVERPSWVQSMQAGAAAAVRPLRPAGFVWEAEPYYPHRDGPPTRYISDPYTYLGFAREMRSFYRAHYREPLFVLATRAWLWLLDDQDVAVSFASLAFSVAAVAAVLALGWYAFSPWVGIGAAALMAIEYELVTWGASGWRDEAFVAIVPLWALALLRVSRAPTARSASVLGIAGGIALLIRITSVTFAVPGLLYLLVSGTRTWRTRAAAAGIAALVSAVIVSPYLVNCWREFGDPLYAINHHAGYYEAADGSASPSASATGLVRSAALARPFGTFDTMAVGLTAYPFLNKWNGFDVWLPGLGWWLSAAALAGLTVLIGSATGRLLLVVLVTSLIPFSLTWRHLADWRFTEHAYPFFLLAACVAVSQALALVRWLWRGRPKRRALLQAAAFWGAVAVGIGAAGWVGTRVLPVLAFAESVALGEATVIEAGRRDRAFFGTGWSAPARQGAIAVRTSDGFRSVVRLPLRRPGDYDIRLRVDPFPAPAGRSDPGGVVRVFANGRPIGLVTLGWDPERVGSYDLKLPLDATRAGFNQLELVLDAALSRVAAEPIDSATGFKLWYVLVRAAAPD